MEFQRYPRPLPLSLYNGKNVPELRRRIYQREGEKKPSHHPPTVPRGFIMICYCSTLMKLDTEKRDWSCAKQQGN